MPSPSRRTLLASSAAVLMVPPGLAAASVIRKSRRAGELADNFPAQHPDDVREVVGKAHGDLDTVVKLITKRPALARASWDWGFGDWESALGAASHMGRPDIAEALMHHGARPNLFTFTMLGNVDIVRAICEASPGIQSTPGPHGITLLRHARAGKDNAASVLAYLEELGGADPKLVMLDMSEEQSKAFAGEYHHADTPDTVFKVGFNTRRGTLTLGRDDRQFTFLRRAEPNVFTPIATPDVRVEFEMARESARSFTLRDGDLAFQSTLR